MVTYENATQLIHEPIDDYWYAELDPFTIPQAVQPLTTHDHSHEHNSHVPFRTY